MPIAALLSFLSRNSIVPVLVQRSSTRLVCPRIVATAEETLSASITRRQRPIPLTCIHYGASAVDNGRGNRIGDVFHILSVTVAIHFFNMIDRTSSTMSIFVATLTSVYAARPWQNTMRARS